MNWEIGTHIYILPYVRQRASGNLLYPSGSSAQGSLLTWGVMWVGREAHEGGDTCVGMAGSLCSTAETNTALLGNYITISKKGKPHSLTLLPLSLSDSLTHQTPDLPLPWSGTSKSMIFVGAAHTNPENFQHIKLAHGGYSDNQIIGILARKLILEII